MPAQPTEFARRSFVYRTLAAAGAEFAEVAGGAVAMTMGGTVEDEAAQARRLGLADLSVLPRIGFKGRRPLDWLAENGAEVEKTPNRAFPKPGGLVAVLAMTEVLVLGDLRGGDSLVEGLESAWSMDAADGVFPVPRRDSYFWFAISGEHAGAMFAKLCAVDLRPRKFPPFAIAQTSVARTNCVVIRHDMGDVPGYYLLGDGASAEYLWPCLLDAMTEFEGGAVGLAALWRLAGLA